MPALITPLRMPSGSHPVSSDHESGTASCGRNDMLDFKHLEDVTLRREAIAVPRSFSCAGNDAIRDSRFRHGLRRGRSPRRSASAIVWDCRRRPISYSRIRAATSARSRSVSSPHCCWSSNALNRQPASGSMLSSVRAAIPSSGSFDTALNSSTI
jgi:hypothetical protein